MGKVTKTALAVCAGLCTVSASAREAIRQLDTYQEERGYSYPASTPPPAPSFDSRCQSANLCVFNGMPIYDQSSSQITDGLDRYANAQNGCGVVSTMMMSRAVSNERAIATRFEKLPIHSNLLGGLVNIFSEGKGLPVSGPLSLDEVFRLSIPQQSKYMAAQVNYTGVIGVLPSALRNGISRFVGSVRGASTNRLDDEVGALENIQKDFAYFRNSIRRDKMGYAFLMWGLKQHSRRKYYAFGPKITYHTRDFTSAHYLAVKGFDGESLMAHDPWGYAYKINVAKRHSVLGHVGLGKNHTFLEPVAGSTLGYVGRSHAAGGVMLGSYVGWSLK